MKTRLLIIIGIVMITTIPFVTYAILEWHYDSVLQDSFDTDASPKPGDKYYIEPERKVQLVAVEQDLRSKITQLHQNSLTAYGVNLDYETKKIMVIVETEQFNSEIEEIISEYPDDIPIVFYNSKIEFQEFESELDINCMTLEQSKDMAPFFKVPSYLPEGYSVKCSSSGMPYESYVIYHNKDVSDGWKGKIPDLIDDGAIFVYQVDEMNIVDEEKYATLGTAEQRIQSTYDSVMESNPSLQPQLIRINGMLVYAVDSCPDCGMQTADFPDGMIIQKSTSTETKIKFIDGDGITYMLKTTLPLDELIRVAESLQ